MSEPQQKYTSMDMVMTGHLIKRLVSEAGFSVTDVQEKLGLSCPQPIYRWYKGRNLPSVDNLYILSGMLGLHMEDLLIQRDENVWLLEPKENKFMFRRFLAYMKIRRLVRYDSALVNHFNHLAERFNREHKREAHISFAHAAERVAGGADNACPLH